MNGDGDFTDGASLPLRGVVLCCTSIPPELRSHLASCAQQMGAVNQLDLTSDVTHLVVGELNTPKYRYVAKERPDVKVLDRDWIEAVRQSWIEGGETDVKMLEEKHRFPVFLGLKICFTGVEDVEERQKLQELVTANGAEYHADLTKQVTHLMAKKPEGKKYLYATSWGLNIVTEEWLRDSLERGMTLDEREYTHSIPQEERGKNAWVRRTALGTCLGKRSRGDCEDIMVLDGEFGERRKLRRSASQKLGSQNVSIWDDITGGGFGGKGQWKKKLEETPLDMVPSGHNAIAASNHKRQNLVAPAANPSNVESGDEKDRGSGAKGFVKSKGRGGLFRGRRFVLHGFDQKKTSVLKEHLLSHDAEISSSISDLSQSDLEYSLAESYVVVPHSSPLSMCPEIPEGQATIVNEWWIERCIHGKSFVDPEANVTSRPFPCFPLAGFERMIICSTAFGDVDLLHVSKLVGMMGATYDGSLTKKTSVLVCNSTSSGMKIKHAFEWNIPAVSAEWLWDCVRTGQAQPFDEYRIPVPKKVVKPPASLRSNKVNSNGPLECEQDAKEQTNALLRRTSRRMANGTEKQPQCDIHHAAGKPAEREPSEGLSVAEPQMGTRTMRFEENHSVHPDKNDASKSKRGTPLQDIGPEVNSSTPNEVLDVPKVPIMASGSGQQKGEDIGDKIAELLRHQQGQLLRDQTPTGDYGRRPRCGLLGRAASNVSHASLSLGLSGASSGSPDEAGGASSSKKPITDNIAAAADGLELLSQERSHALAEVPLASQVVTYEDPEALRQKERVMRKLRGLEGTGGTTPKPKERKTAKGTGVARDSAAVKRSTRQKTYW